MERILAYKLRFTIYSHKKLNLSWLLATELLSWMNLTGSEQIQKMYAKKSYYSTSKTSFVNATRKTSKNSKNPAIRRLIFAAPLSF